MGGTETVTTLIGDIYEAALDPSAWPNTLRKVNEFVGAQASGIYSRDAISKTGVTHHYFGADPFYIQLYAESHARYDPLAIFPPKGRVTAIPDLVSYEEYRRGPFYREWLRSQGFADAVNVVLANCGLTRATLLTVLPGKSQMVDFEMRHRVELIVPHLQRAILIHDRLDEKQEESARLSEMLDGLETAIFLVNAEGRVVHVNDAGKSMLRSARIFRLNGGGRLAGSDAAAEQTLRDLLDTNVQRCEAHATVLANRDEGEHHYVIQRLKLGSYPARASKAVAAVLVRKTEIDLGSAAELIAIAFGLTPMELRVFVAIVELGGIPEAAVALDVAETTVKTHLHRIFSKTGTNRQVHLARLAAGFLTPLIL
jgi:DNA-binding CsgD family transcriptional regulator